jgi:hypothetical protein
VVLSTVSEEELSFRGRDLPGRFRLTVIRLAPGEELAPDPELWRGALAVVEEGEVEVTEHAGTRRRHLTGDAFWVCGQPVALVVNPGPEPAVVAVVARRDPDQARAG